MKLNKLFLVIAAVALTSQAVYAADDARVQLMNKEIQTLATLHASIKAAKVDAGQALIEIPVDAFKFLMYGLGTTLLYREMKSRTDLFNRGANNLKAMNPRDGFWQPTSVRIFEKWAGVPVIRFLGYTTLLSGVAVTAYEAGSVGVNTIILGFDATELAVLEAQVLYARAQLDKATTNMKAAQQ